jgi:hypothetical protein
MRGKKIFSLLMAMRTGKSKIICDEFGEMVASGEAQDLLLVAPAGVYKTWIDEFKKQWPTSMLDACYWFTWESGAGKGKGKLEELKHFLNFSEMPRVFFVNVEALSSVEEARAACIKFLSQRTSAMVVDECFPPNTNIAMSDGSQKSIGELCVGDIVASSSGPTTVIKKHIKRSNLLLKLILSDGRIIRTTPNHPFFTDEGWVCAGNSKGCLLYDQKAVCSLQQGIHHPAETKERTEILQSILLSEMAHATARDKIKGIQSNSACEKISYFQEKWKEQRETFLEQRHSDACVITKEIEHNTQINGPQTPHHWWEWSWLNSSAANFADDIRPAMENGARHFIGRKAARLSNLLQGRLSLPEQEMGNRMRWSKPQRSFRERKAQEKSKQNSRIRVENIEIEEYRNSIDVFDLELEGTPHFFAEGILVHNSTTIKNPTSQRTKFINKRLRPLATYRRILSGLPTPRSPLDLYSQFEFLDPRILGHDSYWTFRRAYGVIERKFFGGRGVDVVVGYQNVEELQRRIEPHSYRVTLEQVRDALPPVYKRWDVGRTGEQERIYGEVRDKATAMLSSGDHVTSTIVIDQINKLHQVLCGHVRDEEGKLHDVPEKRIAAILDILADYDGKAIIWTCYDHSVRSIHAAIEKEYGEGSCARFWGGNLGTREDEERAFKTIPRCRFIVATQSAGGRGRTWSVADLHIFHANSYDLEHRDQAEQRAEGVDKPYGATRVDLVTPGTVDEKRLEALRAKIDLAATVTGDAWREWIV